MQPIYWLTLLKATWLILFRKVLAKVLSRRPITSWTRLTVQLTSPQSTKYRMNSMIKVGVNGQTTLHQHFTILNFISKDQMISLICYLQLVLFFFKFILLIDDSSDSLPSLARWLKLIYDTGWKLIRIVKVRWWAYLLVRVLNVNKVMAKQASSNGLTSAQISPSSRVVSRYWNYSYFKFGSRQQSVRNANADWNLD